MKASGILLASMIILFSCAAPKVLKPVEAPKVVDSTLREAKVHNCNMCHLPHQKASAGKMLLNKPIQDLCISCHNERTGSGEHKVDVKPAMPVEGLPLDSEGKITCITCHDPHESRGYKKLLRAVDFNALCLLCHKNY